MSNPNGYYLSIAEEIRSKINRLQNLIPKSNLASGEYNEEIVRNSLRNFLPDRFTVKRGYIYYDENSVSQQTDIVVIDENESFSYIFKDRDLVVVRPESVMAVVEVKTTLNINGFQDSFLNIFNTKLLKKKALGVYGHIFGAVIGFRADVQDLNDRVLDNWFKKIDVSNLEESHPILWPDAFLFFDEGMLLFNDHNKVFDNEREYYYKLFRNNKQPDIAWQLALFITFIIAQCESEDNSKRRILSPTKALENFDMSDAMKSYDRFRPGEGHSRSSEIV